ncbi:hypothetical protein FRC17_010797 [Serendipita sp. 399]|nr:hypothetical protein FRC17_010797 [Serendipita sp. 399]
MSSSEAQVVQGCSQSYRWRRILVTTFLLLALVVLQVDARVALTFEELTARGSSSSAAVRGVFSRGLEALKSAASNGRRFVESRSSSGRTTGLLEKRTPHNKTVWISAKTYEGANFFDEWDFFTSNDPTNGLVNYVDRDTAIRNGLVYVTEEGKANMHVDNRTVLTVQEVLSRSKLRPSVRISTKAKYNHGLYILDVAKAPYGCGTWPAYWSTNSNWPNDGEIDIIENVHSSVSNQVSWHATEGCVLTTPGNYTGTAGSTNCDARVNSNTGCGIVDPSIASFGAAFNEKGGGVYAMKWDNDSIDVWFFYRVAVPDDILQGLPDPSKWPQPSASLSGHGCPIDKYFRDHVLIFDTTLCGDWAGTSYSTAGCPGTCEAQVADPASFANATWSINSIKIYNKTVINTAYLEASAPTTISSSSIFVTFFSCTLVFALVAGFTSSVL